MLTRKMTVMLDTADAATPRVEEIRQAVAANALTRALRRLEDFTNEFGERDDRNQAVALHARFSRLRSSIRAGVATDTDGEINKIILAIIELTDVVHERIHERQRAPERTESHASTTDGVLRPQPDDPPPSVTAADRHAVARSEGSALERARQRFRERHAAARTPEPRAVFACRDVGKKLRAFSLADISFVLNPGEITGLVGINGAGKTTLLRIVAGELVAEGEVAYPALAASSAPGWAAIRSRIAYVPQAPPRWYGKVRECLSIVAAEHGMFGEANRQEVEFMLYRLGLDTYAEHTWNEISGGYKMRFELARALLTRPRLLVLDEPLAPLDVVSQLLFLQDLRDMADARDTPLAIILSSQHLHEVEMVADRIVCLRDGRPEYCGLLSELGADAPDNVFELIANGTTMQDVESALEQLAPVHVESFGKVFDISVPRKTPASQVLHALLQARIEIVHFKDISRSAKRLFKAKADEL